MKAMKSKRKFLVEIDSFEIECVGTPCLVVVAEILDRMLKDLSVTITPVDPAPRTPKKPWRETFALDIETSCRMRPRQ